LNLPRYESDGAVTVMDRLVSGGTLSAARFGAARRRDSAEGL